MDVHEIDCNHKLITNRNLNLSFLKLLQGNLVIIIISYHHINKVQLEIYMKLQPKAR